MINLNDILETINMIRQENLDIRTITMGISLLDCADSDIDVSCQKVYDKIVRLAGNLVKTGEDIEAEYGIPIIKKRISVTPISMLVAVSGGDPVKYAHIVTSTTHKTLRGPRGGVIMMGKDFPNPWGKTTPKGEIKMMSQLLDSAVFPGIQGGPLEHVIAAKAVAFGEALQPEFKEYQAQVQKNAKKLAEELVKRGFTIVSGGTDNHSMLVDLRSKYPDLTGKVAEKALVAADITANKNMVPFDSRSAFQTSGLRLGTPAITTRGAKEDLMVVIAEMIEEVLNAPEDEAVIAKVRARVNDIMKDYPMFAY